MPKSEPQKTAKKAKKTTKKRSKKPVSRSKKQTAKLLDEQRAKMWVLREEGASLSDIAAEIGCHARTVSREFERDPARHAGLVAVQSETRAARWRQIENKSLETLNQAVTALQASMFTKTGRISTKRLDQTAESKLEFIRKMIGPLRMAADSATNKSQLLTGGPTQIMGDPSQGGGIGVDASNMSDDEVIRLAIAHGLTDELPASLREKLAKIEAGVKGH